MRITLKTAGLLGRYLPEGADGRSAEVDVPNDASVAEALDALGIPGDGRFLLSVNGAAVGPAQRSNYRLGKGDTMALLPPLKGG